MNRCRVYSGLPSYCTLKQDPSDTCCKVPECQSGPINYQPVYNNMAGASTPPPNAFNVVPIGSHNTVYGSNEVKPGAVNPFTSAGGKSHISLNCLFHLRHWNRSLCINYSIHEKRGEKFNISKIWYNNMQVFWGRGGGKEFKRCMFEFQWYQMTVYSLSINPCTCYEHYKIWNRLDIVLKQNGVLSCKVTMLASTRGLCTNKEIHGRMAVTMCALVRMPRRENTNVYPSKGLFCHSFFGHQYEYNWLFISIHVFSVYHC